MDAGEAPNQPTPPAKPLVQILLGAVIRFAFYYWISAPRAPSSASVSSTSGDSPFWLVVRILIIALLTVGLAYPIVKGQARAYWGYFRGITPLVLVQCLLVVVVTIAMGIALAWRVPCFDRSWLYRFQVSGGKPMNVNLLPMTVKYVALLYAGLLVMNMPKLAHDEELDYRRGTPNWPHALVRSIRFGLDHCFVGVPLSAGLALSVGGLWFSYQYFRGGVERSTVHHLTYNTIIVTVIVTICLFNGFAL